MTNLDRKTLDGLKNLPMEFHEFRKKALANQEAILEATRKKFRKARRSATGDENVCVGSASRTPGRGDIWHATRGVIGTYEQGDDGIWRGTVTLEFVAPQQRDVLVWASNLVYATEEEMAED